MEKNLKKKPSKHRQVTDYLNSKYFTLNLQGYPTCAYSRSIENFSGR